MKIRKTGKNKEMKVSNKTQLVVLGINQSPIPMPRKFIQEWVNQVWRELKLLRVLSKADLTKSELTLVFLDLNSARQINKTYRNRNYPTDVLSFASLESASLGELLLSPDVIIRQSRENGWSFRQELAYMILHGILHLLGFDHETHKKEAERMFALQDSLFEKLF